MALLTSGKMVIDDEMMMCNASPNVQTWRIDAVETSGDNLGWIYEHNARIVESDLLVISGGKICLQTNGNEDHIDNEGEFTLDFSNGLWARV